MKITLEQKDLEEAVINYVHSTGVAIRNKQIIVEFTQSKKPRGSDIPRQIITNVIIQDKPEKELPIPEEGDPF